MDDKKKKIITWIVIIVIVLIAAYFLFIRKKKESPTEITQMVAATFPLKKGSQGKEVEQLQMYLLRTYGAQFPMFGVDGKWGDETDSAVKKFLLKDNVSKDSYDKWNLASFVTTKFK